jgi:hypothetical protein
MLNLSSRGDTVPLSADDLLAPPSKMQIARSTPDKALKSAYGQSGFETSLVNPWRNVTTSLPRPKTAASLICDHADPISPLRDRDIAELSGLFDRDDILDLEQNVNHCLIRLFPEPFWEENEDLSFLKEHL